jgi:hypothetical protein
VEVAPEQLVRGQRASGAGISQTVRARLNVNNHHGRYPEAGDSRGYNGAAALNRGLDVSRPLLRRMRMAPLYN